MNFAVIFDMDGVLVNNAWYHLEAWRLYCLKHGKTVTFDEIVALFGNTNELFLKKLINPNFSDAEVEQFAIEKENLYRQLFDKEVKPADGLIIFLDQLKQNQIVTAVATSAPPANLNFVLNRCNLRGYFNTLVDESFVTHGKPNPEIYLKTAELLNISPSKCVVIEDSLFGIEAAQRAGMKVIGIASSLPAAQIAHATMVINSFTELNLNNVSELF